MGKGSGQDSRGADGGRDTRSVGEPRRSVLDGSSYYDHQLTQIEKGKLISSLNRLSNSVAENEASPISEDKDSDISSTVQEKLKKVLKINLRCLDAPFLWCC